MIKHLVIWINYALLKIQLLYRHIMRLIVNWVSCTARGSKRDTNVTSLYGLRHETGLKAINEQWIACQKSAFKIRFDLNFEGPSCFDLKKCNLKLGLRRVEDPRALVWPAHACFFSHECTHFSHWPNATKHYKKTRLMNKRFVFENQSFHFKKS